MTNIWRIREYKGALIITKMMEITEMHLQA